MMKRKLIALFLSTLMILLGCDTGGGTNTTTALTTAPSSTTAITTSGQTQPATTTGQVQQYKDGMYTAEASGYGGPVSVSITLAGDEATKVEAVGATETAEIGGKALPVLAERIQAANNSKIDIVSGATMTSQAVIQAAADCFRQAEATKTEVSVKMKPGTYTAKAVGFSLAYPTVVEVDVTEDKITAVRLTDQSGDTTTMIDTVEKALLPRIVEAQSVGIDGVTGATSTSNAAKLAVEDCLKQALKAGGSSEDALLQFIKVVKQELTQKDLTTDVLVVGMGGAGTYTALRAAEEGAKVLAIEKQARYGGTTALTSEIMSINPPKVKKQYNGGKDYTDADALYKAWWEYTEGDAKKEMLDLFFAKSGEAFDWLALEQGIVFDFDAKPGFTPQDWYEVKFQWYFKTDKRGEVAANFDRLVEKFKSLGGDYMLETEATELITDDQGAVVGVKAHNKVTNTDYTIKAKAVVMATGGFLGNGDMLKKYLSDQYYPLKGEWKVYGSARNDGKMIQAAIDNGAATYNIGMPPEVHMSGSAAFLQPGLGFKVNYLEGTYSAITGKPEAWSVADLPMFMGISSDSLAVGLDGKRFASETGISMLDPWRAGPNYYSIWSTEQINKIRDNGFKNQPGGPASRYLGYNGPIPKNTPLPEAFDVLEAAVKEGFVFKAETIEELAGLIGIQPDILASTVADYNGYVGSGTDTEFKKPAEFLVKIGEGPYYAVKMASYSYNTCAGLDVNSDLQVLKTSGDPIPGLYAVGSDSAGVLFSEKKPYVTFGGANNGWVLTSGYICGESAAKYVKSK
ncbi:FAD-dependent oxidoreductase [Proteiniclasticum sp. QWL-01]|uniref:FAD-dependent oxidoreductase n=1 Tax=Proteiniclasticum sp. QWL-01 TaxID=3036945 RepID=UPI00240FA2E9|nr:FAD-dependent oxidoreductase [Proteiniclasticum sp. QWL-01]WFF72236.1 FAD-dependent oxidoreductase [Proteiniclasticum sp. QWL-01]